MDELRSLAGPVVQRHFEKVEEERQALQARLEAERAKKAAEAEARKAAEGDKQQDEDMTDADANKIEIEEVDP